MSTMPLPVGTPYRRSAVEKVIDTDETDDAMPYRYLLKDGTAVWIPADYEPPTRSRSERDEEALRSGCTCHICETERARRAAQ